MDGYTGKKIKNEGGYPPLRTSRFSRWFIPINPKRKQMHAVPKLLGQRQNSENAATASRSYKSL
jgi:hypothetical protein